MPCNTQAEIAYPWGSSGRTRTRAVRVAQGQYGVLWQIAPAVMPGTPARQRQRAHRSRNTGVLKMKKFDIAELKRAAAGYLTLCSVARRQIPLDRFRHR